MNRLTRGPPTGQALKLLTVTNAKKPPACLEYIVVHEMVHLLERHHNDRFRQIMDSLMSKWQLHRDELNRAPLTQALAAAGTTL